MLASTAKPSLATHKTDRNDARGLAHLARTGFFKPVHVKSDLATFSITRWDPPAFYRTER
jgi:hypothetical protein